MFEEVYDLYKAAHCAVSSSLPPLPASGLNILLSTLFSNLVNLCSSFTVRNQVPHQYKTTGKITAFYSGRSKTKILN
jgi:polysaccharide pyruvyl transferase WcaK-like protein